jgi:hypothetical protein
MPMNLSGASFSRLWMSALVFASAASAGVATLPASLTVEDQQFVLRLPDGQRLRSAELIGTQFQTQAGQIIRIEAVTSAHERSSVLLHTISVRDGAGWRPLCRPDPQGRNAAFPVAGRWDDKGRFVKDAESWFLTCTSGSQGKCILWGYGPWNQGPGGKDLAPFYQACQFAVRADYDASGRPHTKDGTTIDVSDILGIAEFETSDDRRFAFEAGWSAKGAVCVARTRWSDILTKSELLRASPHLKGHCSPTVARDRGALLMTRVRKMPAGR